MMITDDDEKRGSLSLKMLKHITQENPNFKLDDGLLSQKGTENL